MLVKLTECTVDWKQRVHGMKCKFWRHRGRGSEYNWFLEQPEK
jgi:hypothetical protein